MAIRKRNSFCIVNRSIDEESYRKNPCHDRHVHISWKELNELHSKGFLEPIGELRQVSDCAERESVPDYVFEWLIIGSVLKFKRHTPTRGLSAKYGPFLAQAIRDKEDWAKTMVAQMRGELETSLSKD